MAAIGSLWLATVVQVYRDARHEVEEVFDAHLAQYSRVLMTLVARASEEEELEDIQRLFPFMPELFYHSDAEYEEATPFGHRYERKLVFEVWNAKGELLLRSPGAPIFLRFPEESGYSDRRLGDHVWRVFNLVVPYQPLRVRVAERDDVRGELAQKIALRQLMPGLFSLPLLGVVIWLVVRRGLAPLQRVAGEVARRSPEQLEPITVAGVPKEIRPLIDGLNRLFVRLNAAFERERRFTADAAHELRTPLAAIKTQAQVAQQIEDGSSRHHALNQIMRGVDRTGRLVEQLLVLSRLDPEVRGGLPSRRLDLYVIAREVVADLAPAAVAKGVDLALEGDTQVPMAGDPFSLAILLRNLIDNAVRYAPSRGRVDVFTECQAGTVRLRVVDTGPGIPEEQRQRIFERFYRGLGHESTGSGLGLSIVQRIAELHGARIELLDRTEGTGLEVRVIFAAPDTKSR